MAPHFLVSRLGAHPPGGETQSFSGQLSSQYCSNVTLKMFDFRARLVNRSLVVTGKIIKLKGKDDDCL